jgi:pimeloyl-ACP methyl ester carboxylesterase
MIRVAPNVSLHVMEWGGRGETVLFLSGLLSSAHAFDNFARLFSDRYRVVGITRRGVPPSDSSTTGYAASQTSADIVTVMDSLRIDRAHVVGWSFGGDEAVMLAVNYPKRVRSVVLLESYDNSRAAGTFKMVAEQKYPPFVFAPLDSSSVVAFTWRTRRYGARPLPLTHYCTTFKFGPDGRFAGSAAPGSRAGAIISGMPLLPYSKVQQPVLAFYRLARAMGDDYPEYPVLDSANKLLAVSGFRADSAALAAARNRLRTEVPKATVIEIPGATHSVFADAPEIVFQEMLAFFQRVRSNSQ